MREIELHIDTLLVEGVSQKDGIRAGDALGRELVRLLERSPVSGALAADRDVNRIDAGSIAEPATARPAALGRAVAHAVHQGLRR